MLKNSVCFLSNYSKTYLFNAIAKELENCGIQICWIAVNRPLYSFLVEHYPPERVLLVNWNNKNIPAPKIGEFKLNELIIGDRCLRLSPDAAKDYLLNIQTPIYDFIEKQECRWVVGELTWGHEVLTHRIISQCKELACTYLNPHTIRIPNRRFAFFTDEYQSQTAGITKGSEPPSLSNNFKANKPQEIEKPNYLAINDEKIKQSRSIRTRLKKIKRFITKENIDRKDPTLIANRWQSFKIRTAEELNKELYRFVKRVSFKSIANKSFVFVALHKQPEASIDVIGRYYEDQFQNIVNLWRIIPDDWLIVVKEHTNAIGDRNLSFYHKLQKYPGIVFVHERTDSHVLIRHCQLVVTVSGTVAYEAALMGKHSVTFAPTFFNRLPFCRAINYNDLKETKNIMELINYSSENLATDVNFNQYLNQNSFPGTISDPISDSKCLDQNNIRQIKKAFLLIMKSAKDYKESTK